MRRIYKCVLVLFFVILIFLHADNLNLNHGIQVIQGIDRIDEVLHIFKDKKVGLITNHTGINSKGERTIDVLCKKVNLVCLFAPEHGIKGHEREGAFIRSGVDKKTSLNVFSLYGETKIPTKDMLKDIDVLCFDIQDIGARFYTYIYTMANAMKACARDGKTFVVFDRPNPINGVSVEGNILDENYSSFVGLYKIVQRHGMTVGELALMFNTEFNINCTLQVITLKNWNRLSYFDDLNLMWIPPSPNIPNYETALIYSGFCIFEGVNISVGRGTAMPFKYIGAPYINAHELTDALNNLNLQGVFFYPAYFTPSLSVYKNKFCEGVFTILTDKHKFLPVKTAIAIMYTIRKMYPNNFKINDYPNKRCGLNLLTGTDKLTEGKISLYKYFKFIEKDEKRFIKLRKKYLLY